MFISLTPLIKKATENSLLTLNLPNVNFNVEYPPDFSFGQFSVNVAMVLAKKVNKDPRELAVEIINQLKQDSELQKWIDDWQIAGPGFINAYVNDSWQKETILNLISNKISLSNIGNEEVILMEYYQPNIAKPLHVGHLRSAIIGDSMRRIYESLGYKVITDTHMGDWGTQFGLLLYAFKQWGDKDYINQEPIPRLLELYTKVNKLAKEDDAIYNAGKNEFVLLEKGDSVNLEIWRWIIGISLKEFSKVYGLLNILPHDYNFPESFYEDKMPAVIESLKEKNLIMVGETGEQYVDLEDVKLGRCIIVKSDGATTYHLRDLATYIFRKEKFNFKNNYYFVDTRQAHHFRQLFAVLEKMGYSANVDSKHISFGFMTLSGATLSTRSGDILKLEDVVKQIEMQAKKVLLEKSRNIIHSEVLKKISIASIKFFDFSHEYSSDIDFSWEKVLSFEGKTGVYILYGLVRLNSIIKKAQTLNIKFDYNESDLIVEKELITYIGKTEEIIIKSHNEFSSHVIAEHIYKIILLANSWYDQAPIISESNKLIQSHRLSIAQSVVKTSNYLLRLLGIESVDEL